MSDKLKKIGGVTLDYTYYPGEDYYSEGAAEDLLLDIVKTEPLSSYDKVIQQHCSWSVLYHLSHIRENVISWLPIAPTDKVLEVGSGCGAITGDFTRRAASVTCIELSEKRSLINATRHADCDNLTIMLGNFETIEAELTDKYDVITLIGVLEYASSYLSCEHQHHSMIEKLKSHLAPGGRIVIAIENRLGLKYFAGCKEDHTGEYFGGIQGYRPEDGVRTFSRPQLKALIEECGLKSKFYYPYPDYKLPHTIYSDDKLPDVGELTTNGRNLDNDRMVLFDETRAFDAIIQEGVFPTYANSFIVVATEGSSYDEWDNVPIYAKYSDERMEQLRISTQIFKDSDGKTSVYKQALSAKANKHVKKISTNNKILDELFSGSVLHANKSEYIQGIEPTPLIAGMPSKARDRIKLDYVSGITMSNYIDELEAAGEYEKIESIIAMYADVLNNGPNAVEFKTSAGFEEWFGKRNFKKSYVAAPVVNFDMIFSNIVLDKQELENGKWEILDYEWVFDFPVPVKFIIYRTLFYQFGVKKESAFEKYLAKKGTDVYSICGIDLGERMLFDDMERHFQRYIIDGVASLEVMQVLMPSASIGLDKAVKQGSYLRGLKTPKIYYSRGKAFRPDQRFNIIAKEDNGMVSMHIPFDCYLTTLRIDPTEYPCMVFIQSIRAILSDGSKPEIESVLVNGYPMSNRMIMYNTDDAQIVVDKLPEDAKSLEVIYFVTMYDDVFFGETAKLCQQAQEKEHRNRFKFAKRVLRKLKLLKNDVPEGYYRISTSTR